MNLFRQILLTSFFALLALGVTAQDIHFSQFYNSPLNLNPAMTGVMNCNIRLIGNYRNQWSSVLRSNAFKTYAVSYDQKIPVGRSDYFGFGLGLWGDKAGELSFSTTQAKLSASYSKRMGGDRRGTSHYLVVGAEAGIVQRSIDFIAARFGSQYDYDLGEYNQFLQSGEFFDNDNIVSADFGAGLLWFTTLDKNNSFYGGVAFAHLNSPKVSFIDSTAVNREDISVYSKFTIHGGGEFMLSDRMGIVPNLVALIQGPDLEINPGASLKFLMGKNRRINQAFQLGLWGRLSNYGESGMNMDAIILSTRFDYENFGIGISYDINVSDLRAASNGNGGFEFSLLYNICGNERRGVYCPNF